MHSTAGDGTDYRHKFVSPDFGELRRFKRSIGALYDPSAANDGPGETERTRSVREGRETRRVSRELNHGQSVLLPDSTSPGRFVHPFALLTGSLYGPRES